MAVDYVRLYDYNGVFRGFVINHMRRNYWRVQRYMREEDVIQEGALQFILLLRRIQNNRVKLEEAHPRAITSKMLTYVDFDDKEYSYPAISADLKLFDVKKITKHTIQGPDHLMALWKTTWVNHFTTLSIRDSKKKEDPETEFSYSDDDPDSNDNLIDGHYYNESDGYIECLKRDAGDEVSFLFDLMFNADRRLFERTWQAFENANSEIRGLKLLNDFIITRGGLKATMNVVAMFKAHFRSN